MQIRKVALPLFLSFSLLSAANLEQASFPPPDQLSLQTLFSSLDPLSLTEHLAFYDLYPETTHGKLALQHAWELLKKGAPIEEEMSDLTLPEIDLQPIISLITRQPHDPPALLSEKQLALVNSLCRHFPNRKLRGASCCSRPEVLTLPLEEIDLSRALLLYQFDETEQGWADLRQYEATLDLLALQIAIRLPEGATPEQKIHEINRMIFLEMQFKFPPHSLSIKEIDLYTFLPSVLDARQGVCLGVSILYLCLAQRLALPLEVITPPGHIYLRYRDGQRFINIETTARGIDLPSETYLGINTRSLEKRTIREVIGMAFFNEAGVFLGKGDYGKTVSIYEKSLPFLENDPSLSRLLGISYLFIGKEQEGRRLLEKVRGVPDLDDVSTDPIADDYLEGNISIDGIKPLFLRVDENRESIIAKQQALEKIIAKYPKFRSGLFGLASTWMQLSRTKEALQALQQYHAIDPNDATVEYYLSVLSLSRIDYDAAWRFFLRTEELTAERGHHPRALTNLKKQLLSLSTPPASF